MASTIDDVLHGDARWAVVNGDCRPVLAAMPDGAVDAVISDWPYGVEVKGSGGQLGWDTIAPYHLLPEFLRIATGPVVLFGAAPRLREDLASFAVAPQRTIIWAPAFTFSHTSANGMFYRFHTIFCWRIPKEHDGPGADVITHNTEGRQLWNHNCTKPLLVMSDMVGFCRDDGLVLDPFVGSGTTVVAALRRGRRAIGIELDAGHAETARARASAEEREMSLKSANAGQMSLVDLGAKVRRKKTVAPAT